MSNLFLIVIAVLYGLAGLYYGISARPAYSILMSCYAVSNIALIYIGK